LNDDVDLGIGAGGGLGLGTAMARGGVALARGDGVSGGLAGDFFFFGVGESEPDWPVRAVDFFFFFPFGDSSFAGDFFGLGCVVASGVSFGLGDVSGSSSVFFFAFDFPAGDGDADAGFFFLCGEVFGFGVGDFSSFDELTARAFRIGLPSSVVCCA
jgi:hypothetical protein